jgi:hypothetical protein
LYTIALHATVRLTGTGNSPNFASQGCIPFHPTQEIR